MRALLVIALLAGGCARDLVTAVPGAAPGAGGTGTVELRFTRPVRNVHVSVDGVPVATDVHTQRVVIGRVPTGGTTLFLAADGVTERSLTLDLSPGQRVVIPVAAPPTSGLAGSVLQAMAAASVYVAYMVIRDAL